MCVRFDLSYRHRYRSPGKALGDTLWLLHASFFTSDVDDRNRLHYDSDAGDTATTTVTPPTGTCGKCQLTDVLRCINQLAACLRERARAPQYPFVTV